MRHPTACHTLSPWPGRREEQPAESRAQRPWKNIVVTSKSPLSPLSLIGPLLLSLCFLFFFLIPGTSWQVTAICMMWSTSVSLQLPVLKFVFVYMYRCDSLYIRVAQKTRCNGGRLLFCVIYSSINSSWFFITSLPFCIIFGMWLFNMWRQALFVSVFPVPYLLEHRSDALLTK